MLNNVPVEYYLGLASILFTIGVMGVLFRRNAIIVFMCIELMLNAVNLLLTAFSTLHGDAGGQVMVFFIMAVAAAEVAVGLAILVMMALALPFAYMHVRAGGISLKIFAGIMLGLVFHLLNSLFAHLGAINTWPPVLSATTPAVMFMVLAWLMLYRATRA